MKTIKKMFIWIFGISTIIALAFFFFMRISMGYTTQDGKVLYRYVNNLTWKKESRLLENADAATFKSFGFSGVYGKDKHHVYLEGVQIKDADPNSFEILEALYQYAKDKNYLFAEVKKIGEIEDGFEYLGNGFAKNNIHAFRQGRVIKGANGKTFELLDEKGLFAKDEQFVFSGDKIIEGADVNTFHQVKHNFYADKNHVYYFGNKILNADPTDFKVLSERYVRSGAYVFYEKKIIPEADAASFIVLEDSELGYAAKDKNYEYSYGERINK